MKVAIVNEMIMSVEILRRILLTIPDCQLAWVAHDGADAVAKCAKDTPDLILMDLFIPIMDGVEATRQIMKNFPCAILIVTGSVDKNVAKVFEALGYGALDAVSTPVLGSSGSEELLSKIATIRKLLAKSTSSGKSNTLTKATTVQSTFTSSVPPLVAIGCSTGGPNALAKILGELPANFGASVVIVQHLDAYFATGLIEWLNQQTPLPVLMASAGDRPEVGKVLIAVTNDHLCLQSNMTLKYTRDPIDYPYRPSVDVFFKSVAQYWKRRGTAVLLTGMGRDGAQGLSALRSQGWHTIAQNQATCVVYGMPKAAVELDAAVEILPLEAIAPTLIERLAVSH
ncbi:chemotaxis response regulator protein-glutamate methylesterase [Aetokthonos hydrillicola Thurmond2011]|jgi:two-component system response regulator WspF|uniref:Protein-glutamate methylesterase/protein-glutamine glutaminase n=2 Tax=Aetokthonos TaxID=1550243 RepID=A0AAP5I7E1_9CYAN|nr:chemotaxis response regulator protein-glutamate methylesterase [Aetokthonos hydrillicola]MBO3458714.1 chemotaxis response regulator protein-glutamate methylesterase [Aetokthonos hydrillicola CCALA 1050]MBW4585463.1 chemotaxis response regulator protein-glutamate methylesterase [Aetokthonos hydrillicola CCALA 1050]MDR9896084.1 chemotaxis response regulator protein-glutamate methylesterase [Aetokthonos hydrillicola Thurmond2011]